MRTDEEAIEKCKTDHGSLVALIKCHRALEAENRRLRKALGHIAETSFVAVLADSSEGAAEESKSVTGTEPREGTTNT